MKMVPRKSDKYGFTDEISISVKGDPIAAGVAIRSSRNKLAKSRSSIPAMPYLMHDMEYFHGTPVAADYTYSEWLYRMMADRFAEDDYTYLNDTPILPEHINIANEIREYYTSALTMKKLETNTMSNFHAEVLNICTHPSQLKEREIPIVVSLEKMYHEDLLLDSSMAATKTSGFSVEGDLDNFPIRNIHCPKILKVIDGSITLRNNKSYVIPFRDPCDELILI